MIHRFLEQKLPSCLSPDPPVHSPPSKAKPGLMSETNKEMYLSTNPTMCSKLLRKPQVSNGVTSAKAHDSESRLNT